ncbi:PIG-L family deacetylase [Pengzhenrongella sp.]|jgi:LmbE family N-acetylglucosaminyl deacetylase|uniref:PIG-L family deacetylase n=1 Tax=Pengzhenrongella sp. TaxID=2888820 RepID=UPI002F94E703
MTTDAVEAVPHARSNASRRGRRTPFGSAVTTWKAGAVRALVVLLGSSLVLAGALPEGLRPASAAESSAQGRAGGAMQIVAHEDDDLLFQSPDLLHDVQGGRSVRTVFLTTGDAAKGRAYWSSRERGSLAAYAKMAGVADSWAASDARVSGHSILMRTLTAAPNISLVFMRLPDGNRRGTGMIRYGHQSLMRLWNGSIGSIAAVDGSAVYTSATLATTLTELMTDFRPTTLRAQDWTVSFGTGDNADHTAAALYTRLADQGYRSPHTMFAYAGYPSWVRDPNVTGVDLASKRAAFQAYALHDPMMCLKLWCAADVVASLRLAREYVTDSVPTTASTGRPPRSW